MTYLLGNRFSNMSLQCEEGSNKILIELQHFKQKSNWDCGICCVLMVLPHKHRQSLLKNLNSICKEDGFNKSTWTIDLCYLLSRYKIAHQFYTVTLGVQAEYLHDSFYNKILAEDKQRIIDKFKDAQDNGIDVRNESVSINFILEHLMRGGPIILLTNARLLTCSLCKLNKLTTELRKCLPWTSTAYQGHYIVLCGYDVCNKKVFYRNPSLHDHVCIMEMDHLDEARKSYGTDQDMIVINIHDMQLIIAANRDEFYDRPAERACFYPETNIIGGRDMASGRENGMWLGVSLKEISNICKFRFGALLNITGEKNKANGQGRGNIVANYLNNQVSFIDYTKTLNFDKVNAFNFIAIELNDQESTVHYKNNVSYECYEFKNDQILGFGNSTFTVPLLKVKNGTERFRKIVSEKRETKHKAVLIERLLEFLKWEEKHLPDPELIRRAPDSYEYLSSVFVKIVPAKYGTRTHSIVLIDEEWNIEFVEATMKQPIDPLNPEWETQHVLSRL